MTECSFPNCERQVYVKKFQLCQGHYAQYKQGKTLRPLLKRPSRYNGQKCAVEDCDRPAKTRDWCDSHYQQFLRKGYVVDTAMTTSINDGFSTERYCSVCKETKHWTKYHINIGMCTDCYRATLSKRIDLDYRGNRKEDTYGLGDLLSDIEKMNAS